MKLQSTSGGVAAGQILPEKQLPTEERRSRGRRNVRESEHGWSSLPQKDRSECLQELPGAPQRPGEYVQVQNR